MVMKIKYYLVMAVIVMLYCCPLRAQITTVYVSSSGNDAWSGKLSSVNTANTDGPFATLQKAIGAVRYMKFSKPGQQFRIEMRGGTYRLNQSVIFYQEDAGSPDTPIVITSFPGERAVLSGGMELTNLQTVKDEAILQLLPMESKGKVLQAKAEKFPFYKLELNNKDERFFELFCKGEPMHLARFPENSFLEIADVKISQKDTEIVFSGQGLDFLKNEKDLYCHGYWKYVWYDDYQKVKRINNENHSLTFFSPQPRYGYEKEQRFYFTNVVSKIVHPGDYAFDGATKTVYVYPKESSSVYPITMPLIPDVIKIYNASWITFKEIDFEESESYAVVASKANHIMFDNCTFRNISSLAIQGYDVSNFTVQNCVFKNLGAGGVELHGGDRARLISAHNIIDNNEFKNFSRLIRTHSPAVQIYGVGARISHNVVHDASYTGIYVDGNDNIVEYNELYNLGFETGIGGAIYLWGDQTFLGNEIRNNYIHDVHGQGGYSFRGIHIDGFVSGVYVHHNLFEKCQQGLLIEGGNHNTIENNLFIGCDRAVTVEQISLETHRDYADRLRKNPVIIKGNEQLWKSRYPILERIVSDSTYLPAGNLFARNLIIGKKWLDTTAKDTSIILQKENYISEDKLLLGGAYRVNTKLLPENLRPTFSQIDFENIGLRKK